MKIELEDGFAKGFKMAVPGCFREALAREKFQPGDTFYDTRVAYRGPREESLKHIKCAFQVVENFADAIEYDVLRPANDHSKLVQVERVREPIAVFLARLINGSEPN